MTVSNSIGVTCLGKATPDWVATETHVPAIRVDLSLPRRQVHHTLQWCKTNFYPPDVACDENSHWCSINPMWVSWDKWQQFFNYSSLQRKTRRMWTQLSEKPKYGLERSWTKLGSTNSERQIWEVWPRLLAENWQTCWPLSARRNKAVIYSWSTCKRKGVVEIVARGGVVLRGWRDGEHRYAADQLHLCCDRLGDGYSSDCAAPVEGHSLHRQQHLDLRNSLAGDLDELHLPEHRPYAV